MEAPTAVSLQAERRPRPWAVLTSGVFRSLWLATSLSLVGDFFSYVALAWLVLQLTGSSLALGAVLVAQAVPRSLLMLVGGALVDRLSARLAMLASMGLRVALVGSLAGLVFSGHIRMWEVYVASATFGIVDAFFLPAKSSILPRLVSDRELEPANALLNVTAQGAAIIGPAIAGVVVATLGTAWAFAADAGCFAVGSLFILSLPRARAVTDSPGAGDGLGGQIVAGFRYAWSDLGIRATLLVVAAVDFAANGALGVGLPTLAHGRFGAGAVGLGALLGAWGLGATAGAGTAGFIPPPRRYGWLIVWVCAWIGAGVFAVGLMPSLLLAAAVIAAAGIASGAINTYGISWLQRRVHPEMQGRVMSLLMLASLGLAPIAYAISGVLAQANPTLLFLGSGTLILLAAAGAAASRTVRSL